MKERVMDPSDRRRLTRELRKLGFTPGRMTKHGQLWQNGPDHVLIGRPTRTSDPHASKNLESIIKRYRKGD